MREKSYAKKSKGFKKVLSLIFAAIMILSFASCSQADTSGGTTTSAADDSQDVKNDETTDDANANEGEEDKSSNNDSDSSSLNVREIVDSYEKFADEYVNFMKKYNESDGTDVSLIQEYNDITKQYKKWLEKIENIDEDSLSVEDAKYFVEVTKRVSEKLKSVQ